MIYFERDSKMKVVIIEIQIDTIENVYGPFEDDNINAKIVELEEKRQAFHTTFEIMPLIEKI